MMNIAGLVTMSSLPNATRKIHDLYGKTRVLVPPSPKHDKYIRVVTTNDNDPDSHSEGRHHHEKKHHPLPSSSSCLQQRLVEARSEVAALVFRLDYCSSSSALSSPRKNGEQESNAIATSCTSTTTGASGDGSGAAKMVISDELHLWMTLDGIESDLYGSRAAASPPCTGILADDNNNYTIIGVIDIDTSERSSCCPDDAAGGKRVELDDDNIAALASDAAVESCVTSKAATCSDLVAVVARQVRRLEELETLNAALEAKVSALERATKEKESQKQKQPQPQRHQLQPPPQINHQAGSSPVDTTSSSRRSVAVATVKSLREKLQKSVSSSLDTFKVETAALHQEITRLRSNEKLLTEQVAHLQAAHHTLWLEHQHHRQRGEAGVTTEAQRQCQPPRFPLSPRHHPPQSPENDGWISIRADVDVDDIDALSFSET